MYVYELAEEIPLKLHEKIVTSAIFLKKMGSYMAIGGNFQYHIFVIYVEILIFVDVQLLVLRYCWTGLVDVVYPSRQYGKQ